MTRRTHSLNAYESKVVAGGAGATGDISVESAIGLFATADNGNYLVVDPESATVREYFKVVAVDTGTGLLTCASFRGLGGSVGDIAHAHDGGATVRAVAVHQWIDDIFQDLEDHIPGTNPHDQYLQESEAATTLVHVAGDTMTGDLVLAGDPDADLKAATKQYVDNSVPAFVPSSVVAEASGAGTNITTTWVARATGSIAIPAEWNTYDVLVTFEQSMGSGAANNVTVRVEYDSVTGSESTQMTNYQDGAMAIVHEVFSGETSTGVVSFKGEAQTDTGDCTSGDARNLVTAIAVRVS